MTLTRHENNVIIASLNNEPACKLINRIPGLRLLISRLPGSALRMHVESLGKPRNVNKHSQKPCLVNVISKDTHLVFSVYRVNVSKHFWLLLYLENIKQAALIRV